MTLEGVLQLLSGVNPTVATASRIAASPCLATTFKLGTTVTLPHRPPTVGWSVTDRYVERNLTAADPTRGTCSRDPLGPGGVSVASRGEAAVFGFRDDDAVCCRAEYLPQRLFIGRHVPQELADDA